QAIEELVTVGPVKTQTGWMAELLSDPAVTALNVVTTPEEMPVHETVELVGRVRESLPVPLGAVVVNRVLPELFTHADEVAFEALRHPAPSTVLQTPAGGVSPAVLDAAPLAVSLRRSRSAYQARLRDEVDLDFLLVPYLFVR